LGISSSLPTASGNPLHASGDMQRGVFMECAVCGIDLEGEEWEEVWVDTLVCENCIRRIKSLEVRAW